MGLKLGADLSLKEMQPAPGGYSFIFRSIPWTKPLKAVNVVHHNKYSFLYLCHQSMHFPSIHVHSLHLDGDWDWLVDTPFGKGKVELALDRFRMSS